MKSIWNGTIEFGKVAIPIGLAPTTSSKSTVSFKLLHRPCATPVKQKRVCPHHGDVPDAELVKAWEVAKGQYVLIEAGELEAIAPAEDRTIRISACVNRSDLSALAVERRYYLTPSESPLGRRPYLLLRRALADTETVALARFVAFKSEWLALIRPLDGAASTLLLEKLCFQDELVAATELEQTLRGADQPTDEEAALAAKLAEQLRPFRLRKALLTSDHRERVQQLVEAKLAGTPIVHAKPPAGDEPAQQALPSIDLIDALRRSVKKPPRDRSGRPPRRRATATR